MNLNKHFVFTISLGFILNTAYADNHDLDLNKNLNVKTENVSSQSILEKPKKEENSIENELNNVPLNNPFGGGVGSGSSNVNAPSQTSTNSIATLQGKKLVGIIKGNRKRFALFQSANGSIQMISKSDYLTNDLFIREINNEIVLIEDGEKKVFEVAFNNFIRPMEGN